MVVIINKRDRFVWSSKMGAQLDLMIYWVKEIPMATKNNQHKMVGGTIQLVDDERQLSKSTQLLDLYCGQQIKN